LGLPVEIGETESSTAGNLAVQLAASEAAGERVAAGAVREWAARLCQKQRSFNPEAPCARKAQETRR
jgi:hypothetical protein